MRIPLLCLSVLFACLGSGVAQSTKPNVIIIMADDMGFSDIGSYGGEISTPNLDALAAKGLRFTQFYNTARCCPTRAALLTGLYPHQAGVGHMVENKGHPSYQGFLNDRSLTIAEVLRESGYRTYMSGKWHVGENRPHWPVDRGFDRSYALVSGGTNYFRLDPNRKLARDDQQIQPPADWYVTDAITNNAAAFVKEHDTAKPFFLYVAYTAPHWPLHAPPEEIAKYRSKYKDGWDALRELRHKRQIELGLVDARWPITPRDKGVRPWSDVENPEEKDLRMAVYAAQITRMDAGIGRVMASLRERSMDQNTLVLFLADNGGCAEVIERSAKPDAATGVADSFRSYGVGWANASNTPFRLYKHWVHEGGISTPLIAHWPAVIKNGGALTQQVGHVIDLMPTALDAAGAKYPKEVKGRAITPVEGKSLLSALRGEPPNERTIFWEHEGNRAVRQGNWKLVAKHGGGWELYDLAADRTEMNDLAAPRAEKVKELAALYDAWATRANVVPWGELNAKPKEKAK